MRGATRHGRTHSCCFYSFANIWQCCESQRAITFRWLIPPDAKKCGNQIILSLTTKLYISWSSCTPFYYKVMSKLWFATQNVAPHLSIKGLHTTNPVRRRCKLSYTIHLISIPYLQQVLELALVCFYPHFCHCHSSLYQCGHRR